MEMSGGGGGRRGGGWLARQQGLASHTRRWRRRRQRWAAVVPPRAAAPRRAGYFVCIQCGPGVGLCGIKVIGTCGGEGAVGRRAACPRVREPWGLMEDARDGQTARRCS